MTVIYNLVMNLGVSVYYFKYIIKDIELMSIASVVSVVMLPVLIIAPAALYLLTAIAIKFYGLDKRIGKIREELEVRRAKRAREG